MLIFWCAILLPLGIFWHYIKPYRGRKNNTEIPDPRPWPIIGNLLDVATVSSDMTKAFGELAKRFGEIYSLQMGTKRTVVITSKEAMRTILLHEASLGRDRRGIFGDRLMNKNLGIVSSDGEIWEKTRNWTFKKLKQFGFGQSSQMQEFVENACMPLFRHIDDRIDSAINVSLLFNPSIMTILWEIIVGPASPKDTEVIKRLTETSQAFLQSSVVGTGLINAYPFLRKIFPKILGYNVQMDFFNSCNNIAKKLFAQMEDKFEKDFTKSEENLLEAFVQNCKSRKDDEVFNCENFQIIFQDLLLAGSDATSSFLESIVLYLVTYPKVQDKIYQEIVQFSNDSNFVPFEDRNRMIYTKAFLLEMYRNAMPQQNSFPRRATGDIEYKNMEIKKDTIIMVDLRLYYGDEKMYRNPETFCPERFINEKGELCNSENIISFGMGKRICPGENFANIVIFVILTSLLKRYKLSIPRGQGPPRMDKKPGLSVKPYPFQVQFSRREEIHYSGNRNT